MNMKDTSELMNLTMIEILSMFGMVAAIVLAFIL